MLVEFTVENYKSFRDRTTLSMVAAKITSFEKSLDEKNVIDAKPDLKLLRSAGIYGANASGKSNLASALGFMRSFVIGSARELQAEDPIDTEPFLLNVATGNEPSLFEVVFIIDKTEYRYGFQVNTEEVTSEWLYANFSTKETALFTRDGQDFKLGNRFREGKGVENKTRPNALFLSVVAQFNGALSLEFIHWFRLMSTESGLEDDGFKSVMYETLKDSTQVNRVVEIIKSFDINIQNLQLSYPIKIKTNATTGKVSFVRDKTAQPRILAKHVVYDDNEMEIGTHNFNVETHESHGTRKIIALISFLIQALQNEAVVIIDELDSRLHPLITQAIIKLFNSNTTNPGNAQLIFITHDTNLLDKSLLRRDQIWFAEKDKQGATHLASLVEYKVRNDESFEKNYIQGRYGAIPFIGDLTQLPVGADA